MYESFYQLNCMPFSLLPDPAFLFPSRQHSMALTLLRYTLVSKHPFTVITGEVGAGKTTLINRLLEDIGERHTVGLVNYTDRRVSSLWPWILGAFGIPYDRKSSARMHDDFKDFLIDARRQTESTVLIVDEAQNFGPRALENLRILSNVNTKETLLQMILVGQPEFLDMLRRPDLRQLKQRITVYYKIDPLSELETRAYIAHRLGTAGGRPDTFDVEAIATIWEASGGIARNINTLCDLALVYGFFAKKQTIDASVVEEMITDRRGLGAPTEQSSRSRESTSTALGSRSRREGLSAAEIGPS